MKIVYQNVIVLLAFVAYNYNSLADYRAPEVDVAAFFHEENTQSRIAFETAIFNTNRMDSRVKYNPKINIISETDSLESSNILCNMTQGGTIGGVICPTSPKIAPTIESFCVNLEIPVIHVDWRPIAQYTNSVVINFYPYQRLLFQGLGAVVKNLQWRSIVIFYESSENLIRLQDILKIQQFDSKIKSNSIILKELGPGPDYRSALKQIQNKTEYRIILDCRTENIIPVLKQAKELKLLEKHYSYFFTSLDAHTLDLSVLGTSANITTVRIIDPESSNFQNALSRWRIYASQEKMNVNLDDPYSIKTETAVMYDALNMYLKCVTDVHVTQAIETQSLNCYENIKPWDHGLGIATFIKRHEHESESLHSITGPMKFDDFGRRINFNLFVVEGNREEKTAIWNPSTGENLQFLKTEEDRNKELERKWTEGVLTVASIIGSPYLMKRERPKDGDPLVGNARYEGFSMDLITELAQELKINFQFEVLESGQRGVYSAKTKSWNGLIREILDRRADLAICDLTITPERRDVVDFSAPFMRLGISILYKKPEPKEANMYAFLDPLSLDLWIYSATLYLAITVVLFFIARVSPTDWENPHPCDQEPEELENIWNMKNCLWLTLGSIMNQGCDILPKGLASRMAAAMWWFYTIIVTNSYMANLAAFLTNERSQNTINSAEDLAKQTKVKYGTMEGGSTQEFFKHSNYSVYQRMWTGMTQSKPTVFEKSNDDGVARVKNTKNRLYAFLMESATMEYQIERNCDLMQVGNWLDSKSYGIAMPLDYPHRSRINEALLQLQEKGVINKLKNRWWKEKGITNPCPPDEQQEDAAKLALRNVGGVFLVLAVGVALAYVVAICEFLWNVRNVSVEEHITFMEALKVELKFALNVMVTKKQVKPQVSESSSSHSGASRSLARSILQGAGSFLGLDVLGRHGSPGSTRSRQPSRHSSRPLD